MSTGTHTAFFYGTLMHPSILRRVIGHDGADLEISPALLLEHTRHQVKYADYPGMVPYSKTRQLLCIQPPKPDLPPEERIVRGTIVKGLNDKDVKLLDYFEGAEYTREIVQAHPLDAFIPLSASAQDEHIVPQDPEPITQEFLAGLPPAITAETYVWKSPLSELNPQLWEYAEFVRKHAHKWYGKDFEDDRVDEPTDPVHTCEVDGEIFRTEIVGTPEVGRTVVTAVETNSRRMR